MSYLLKNRTALIDLFTHFNLLEQQQVNQNLNSALPILMPPAEQLRAVLEKNNVGTEYFVSKQCLPLTRFYLAEKAQQKALLLSKERLADLFVSLPIVEATLFKQQIQHAQSAQQQREYPAHLLSANMTHIDKAESAVQFNHRQFNRVQPLDKYCGSDRKYLNCFYYLQAGELFVVHETLTTETSLLLYSELSPLQQLQAQKLVAHLNPTFKSLCELQ
ncbi:hypothetical protein GCM10007916_02200 [Psychromonas marina]|uniref:Uncharacterized protein n=1 Tax=Psychromonas marina TaxID=88364 RepID=A0ABQ6DVV8_9GAMM|nr:hypothetical protein [Psychromonas marina]GLS89153.1 hypothetical protein GCM10007916_02200 [Psychromonas marina]